MPETSHAEIRDGYRYSLTRTWGRPWSSHVIWVMLNPSTADHQLDDPTIRKCRGFSRRWGFGGFHVLNLFAWRATRPRDLFDAANRLDCDIVGPDNNEYLFDAFSAAVRHDWPVVVAWGANAPPDRARYVLDSALIRGKVPVHLGLTLGGQPKHPLMLPYSTQPRPWRL